VHSCVSQESNRPLLLMIDEKRIHALPINALNTEAVSSSVQSLQCYSVQIPIVAYRDVPLQISSTHMQIEKDVPSVCQNGNNVKDGEIVGNCICTRSTSAICSTRESRNEKYQLDSNELLFITIICIICSPRQGQSEFCCF